MRAKGAKQGEILIYEDVGAGWFGGVTAKQFAADLKGLGPVESIDVRINSYGGDVFDGLAIYRQLVDHPAQIIAHVDGVAASIASIIAMSGDEIVMAEAGFLMIHNAWGMAVGNANDVRAYADRLEAVSDQLAGVYVARTGKQKKTVCDLMDAETWFTAEEAIANGFATSVVANQQMAARYDQERHQFVRVPNALLPTEDMRQRAAMSAADLKIRQSVAAQVMRMATRKIEQSSGK